MVMFSALNQDLAGSPAPRLTVEHKDTLLRVAANLIAAETNLLRSNASNLEDPEPLLTRAGMGDALMSLLITWMGDSASYLSRIEDENGDPHYPRVMTDDNVRAAIIELGNTLSRHKVLA